ncbi:LamG-like jellyroll fold domain-containing protein [Marivirga sp.]|uniref:LamG-like jellyroll fold domain-containing protein n=1 Tax=Marivirga sp. TaxID=2018662 RepID=UPI003DA75B1C
MRIIYNFFLSSLFLIGISISISFSQGISISSDEDKTSNSLVESVLAGYPFNGNANDVSANGFNGTVDGQTLTSDRFGQTDQAYQFTSTNGGIQTPLVEQPNAISLWFQTTAESGTLLSWGSGTEGVYGYTVNVLPSGIEFVYNSGDGIEDGSTFTGVTKADLNDGNWHHLVIDIDETNEIFTFYIDNEIIGTDLIAEDGILWAGINSLGMEIGPAIDGRIDNVFLYVGNIFPNEVNTLYHATGWDVPENSLVLNYDFNDGIVQDLGGFGYDFINVSANSVLDRFNTPSNALGLDGIEQFCETSGVPIYDNISISAWFKTSTDFSNGYRSFVDLFGLSALSIGSNNFLEGSLRFGDQDFLILSSDIPVNDGLWHHAVLTYDGSTARLYLDNELIDTNSDFSGPLYQTSLSTFLNVGFIFEPGNIRYYTGEVDDINYYNYGISRSEVIELYSENNWPNTAPIASYPFNGNAYDESGNYLDGSVIEASLTNDRFGVSNRAYNFNGTSSYISVTDDPLFDLGLSTDLAVSGWFNTTASNGVLFDKSDGSSGYLAFFPDDGSNQIIFFAIEDGVGSSQVLSNPGYNDGQWHHFVMQMDRDGGMSIYIDGVLDVENTGALSDGFNPDTGEDFLIGVAGEVDNAGLNTFFNGGLDDFKIFNSLLTDEEIANLYSKNAWPILGQVQIKIDQATESQTLSPFSPNNMDEWGNAFDFSESEFQFVLNGVADKPYGDSDNDGFIDLLGDPILPPNGLNFVRLVDESREYSSETINSVGFLGSARTGDETGWQGEDTDMEYIGDGVFELKSIELFDGFWKIRANDDWNFANWGSSSENPGDLFLFGDDIPISAGTYDITVDVINKVYSVTAAEPDSGLQANYFFNDNFNDDSGNGNNGTGVNAMFGNDRFGIANQAVTFNGSDAYVSVPDASAFNFGTSENIVISGWFRTNSSGVLFDKSNFLSGYFAQIDGDGKLQFLMVEEGGGSEQILTNNTYDDGAWHHYVIQIDRTSSMEIFIDGELESINEVATDGINPDMAEDFLIGVAGGVDNADLNGFFIGLQDDFQIFNQTLSLEEIQSLYSEGGWPITGTPRVGNISPRTAKIGEEVSITGINFSTNVDDIVVSFNGVRANILSNTSTEIKVEVPIGTSHGPVYVISKGLVAQSHIDFNVVYDGNGLPLDSTLFESTNLDLGISSFTQGALVSADFDQDGLVDLEVISANNQFSVLRNLSTPNGEISFDSPIAYNVSSDILKISKGDFDGDGKWDMAVAHGGIISIFQNISNGAGNINFQNVYEITVNGDFIRDLEVTDMNGDGVQDLVVIESIPPQEEFGQTTYTLNTIANLTQDGVFDFSIVNSTDVDFNFGLKLRDLNGDRKTDIVTTNAQVFINLTSFQTNNFALYNPVQYTDIGTTVEVSTADYDNDGKTDFSVVEDNGGQIIGVFTNATTNPTSGEVNFLGPDTLNTGLIPTTIKSADFDGDGLIDIATVDLSESKLSVFQNLTTQIGDLKFAERKNYDDNLNGYDIITGDFNNDGKVDVITSDLVIYRNNLQSADEIAIPENQPTNLSFTNITSNSLTINFDAATNHNGNYLVLRNNENSPVLQPEDGIGYQLNDIIEQDRVVYVGSQTTFVDSLLNQDTRYYYSVFAFNGSGKISLYLKESPLTGDEITMPLEGLVTEPTAQPTNFEVTNFDEVNKSFQVNYLEPSTTVDGYLVVRRLNNKPIFVPSDGQSYGLGAVNNTDSIVYIDSNTQFLEENIISDNEYQYLIFSYNGSEGTINYLQNSPLNGSFNVPATQPTSQPTNFTVNSIGPNSVNFSFTSTENVSGFLVLRNENQIPANVPEDFTSYQYADQINEDVVIYAGSSTSIIDNNLNPQTQYFYSVFAYNGSGDLINYLPSNPLTGNLTTTELPNLANQPQAQPTDFTVISKSENGAELSFTESNAEGYLVVRFTANNSFFNPADGITYNAGNQFGNTLISYVGENNSWTEASLLPETIYNFKIYAFNGVGDQINYLQTSPLSEQITTLTSPPNSQATDFTIVNPSFTSYTVSFNTNFDDSDGYIVIRKEGETPPISVPEGGIIYEVGEELIEGEKVVAIGAIDQFKESDLTADTYSYAVYSYSGESDFINYNTINPLTGTGSVLQDNTAPILQNLQFNEEVGLGDAVNISVTVIDAESGVDEVEVQYVIPGSNSVNTPTIAEMNQSGDDYTYEISDITEAGVEFRIVARNVLGLEAVSTASSVTTVYSGDGLPIPFSSFGTEQSNYRIVSVPIDLNSNTINDVFGKELGDYGDKTQWRMFRYSGESTTELSGTSSLIPGRGYWLIVRDNNGFSFFTGAGKNVDASVEEPYEIVLSPGWNQIGNPYPYDVAWSDVEELNEEELQLKVFNGSFTNGNTLPAFSGGFVNWSGSNEFTLQIPKIPVSANPNRQLKDGEGWELNLILEKDGVVNTLTGIGMHTNAKDDLDSKDEFNLPRFLDYIDLKHNIMANGYYVAKNVVAMHKEFQWTFDIESNLLIDGMNIQWELPNSHNFNALNKLMLWDPSSSNLIDMKSTNQYRLRNSDGKNMKIIYGSSDYIDELIEVSSLHVSDPYPNPTSGILNIQLFVPKDEADSELLLELIDLKGSLVNTNKVKINNSGQQTVEWNVTETSVGNLSGVYMLRISSSKNSINKKIVMK